MPPIEGDPAEFANARIPPELPCMIEKAHLATSGRVPPELDSLLTGEQLPHTRVEASLDTSMFGRSGEEIKETGPENRQIPGPEENP